MTTSKLLFFLLVLLSLFHRTTSQGDDEDNEDVTPSYIPMCKDGYALGEGNGNSRFLGIYPTFTECVAAAQIDYNDILANPEAHNATYPGVSFALQNMCYVVQTMNMTNGDPYIKTCYFAPPTNNDGVGRSAADNTPLVGGDPIIVGWKGQTFKFDGEDGKWYSNLETTDDTLHWNMQFRKYETCPSDENMFISGLSILSNTKKNTNKILIQTTPEPIPECTNNVEGSNKNNCLGGGTLHLSFDEGRTFISQPGDYSFPGNSRIIAHNTYSACSREWFDYALTKQKEEEEAAIANEIASEMRLRGSKNYNSQSRNVKKPYEYMLDNTATMIDPTECKKWIHDRKEHDDIFQQPGLWSTLYIETPLVSFHIEYRQSNPANEQRKCDFQSLDAWISELSPSLEEQEWHGILGETKNNSNPTTTNDRYQLLRGPNDADYEVNGPFGTTHIASTLSSSS